MFSEKYQYFIYVSSGMYSMTICNKSGIKAVYNNRNKDPVTTRGRQNVTSTTTPSVHTHTEQMKELHSTNFFFFI